MAATTFLAILSDDMELDKQAKIADRIHECLQRQCLSQITASGSWTELSNKMGSITTDVIQLRPERYRQATSPPDSVNLYNMMTPLAQDVTDLKLELSGQSRGQSRPFFNRRPHRRSTSRANKGWTGGPDICYYHQRFKEKAWKCLFPCAI